VKNTARKKQLSLSERYEKNKKKIDLTRGGNTDYIEIITVFTVALKVEAEFGRLGGLALVWRKNSFS